MDLRQTRISDNVRVFTQGGATISESFGANCTAVAGREGVLLVDPLIAPTRARQVEEAVRAWTPLPVRFVVLTHHHTDHALGASYFARAGATVVAHQACALRMAAEHPGLVLSRSRDPALGGLFADAEARAPERTFQDGTTLDLGGTRALVIHTGPGHTPGDAIVYLPEESVAVCGDLVSNGYHVNYEDADPAGLDRGLAALAALGARSYVPGHGPAGDAGLLESQFRYHAAARAAARETGDAGARLSAQFPGHLLRIVLPSVANLAPQGARGPA